MHVIINKDDSAAEVEKKLQSLQKRRKKSNLAKHYGKLKRGLNGLEYQKQMRDEWN